MPNIRGYTQVNIKDEVRSMINEKRKELSLKGASETIAHVIRENIELKRENIELKKQIMVSKIDDAVNSSGIIKLNKVS